jgi:hypothetical protein
MRVKMFTRALSPFLIKNLFVEVSSALLGKRERKNETCSLSLSLSVRVRVCVCVFKTRSCLFHTPILMRKIICEDEKKQIFGQRERQDRKSAHEEYQT